jgi:hypothetical protein
MMCHYAEVIVVCWVLVKIIDAQKLSIPHQVACSVRSICVGQKVVASQESASARSFQTNLEFADLFKKSIAMATLALYVWRLKYHLRWKLGMTHLVMFVRIILCAV